ncbi:MAG: hypothetical protein ABGZ35_28810 [Planctomycetaceae bacterium]
MFVRGPIPLAWLTPVLSMRGRSPLALALALRFQCGLEGSKTVRLTHKLCQRFQMSARSVQRALDVLEEVGLIQVARKPGRCHVVTINEVDGWDDE